MKASYDNHPFDWSQVKNTCQLHYDAIKNTFHLLVPQELKKDKHNGRKPWIALDPGVRTFLTGLSEDEALKIGDDLSPKFKRKIDRIDKLQRLPLSPHQRSRIQQRLRDKVKHMRDDLHWKAANFLVKNYDTILIGDMSAKSVVRGKRKGLHAGVKRSLMSLSLFTFRQRLAYKAQQHCSVVIPINEAYTTKVCSCCGTVNEKIGGSRVFTCSSCHHECDRDVDGARCIAIKGLF